MDKPTQTDLSRRERQIMAAIYRHGEASVSDVLRELPDDPSYNSVRVILGILEKKGHVRHRREDRRYIYSPAVSRERATRSALKSLLETFFRGAPSEAILTLLDMSSTRLSNEELDRIAEWIANEKESADAGAS